MCKPDTLPEKYQEAATKIINAVMKHPVNVSVPDRIDYKLMQKYPNKLVVKSGANALFRRLVF